MKVVQMKTNDLRKFVMKMLKKHCKNVYYRTAENDAMYPHIVFTFKTIDLGITDRSDIMCDIDIWDKDNTERIEDITDSIEADFDRLNAPQDTILPTCFIDNRNLVNEEDKTIEHRTLRIQIQNYIRSE